MMHGTINIKCNKYIYPLKCKLSMLLRVSLYISGLDDNKKLTQDYKNECSKPGFACYNNFKLKHNYQYPCLQFILQNISRQIKVSVINHITWPNIFLCLLYCHVLQIIKLFYLVRSDMPDSWQITIMCFILCCLYFN